MGRTNETATQLIRFQQQELARFFSSLRKSDQEAFEDLFALAQFHIAPLAFSGTAEPQTIIYFAMLLEHRATARATYQNGRASFSWQANYIGKAVGDKDFVVDDTVYGDKLTLDELNKIKPYSYHDAQFRYELGAERQYGLYVGIANLFDKKPPFLPGTPFSASPTGAETAADVYDPFGRRFYAGVQLKF